MGTASFFISMHKKVTFHFQKSLGVIKRMNQNRYTKVGTDIEEVKRLNNQSGLSYNEVKKLLAERYLGHKRE
jgi:hypothetical protein